jgi:hypothetical protein
MCQFDKIGFLMTIPDYCVLQMLQRTGVLRLDRCLGDTVDPWGMLEQGRTNEISIRAGTIGTVKGIAQCVREEIHSGCVDGIPSAVAAAAAAGGTTVQWGDCRTRPSPPGSNFGQRVGCEDLLVPFIE